MVSCCIKALNVPYLKTVKEKPLKMHIIRNNLGKIINNSLKTVTFKKREKKGKREKRKRKI